VNTTLQFHRNLSCLCGHNQTLNNAESFRMLLMSVKTVTSDVQSVLLSCGSLHFSSRLFVNKICLFVLLSLYTTVGRLVTLPCEKSFESPSLQIRVRGQSMVCVHTCSESDNEFLSIIVKATPLFSQSFFQMIGVTQ